MLQEIAASGSQIAQAVHQQGYSFDAPVTDT
jgi:hypothetical protein